jgi:betaine-aldehyde dehydrogenase
MIEVTIDSLAELGFVGTTLAQIAARAGVSPGLVAHYFGDKDGLLEAAFRALARRVGDQVRMRMRRAHSPRARIQAIIDANLGPAEFDRRTGTAWLAFWGQVLQAPNLRRIQSVYQKRTLSNLCGSLRKLVPAGQAGSLAAMIAAMIDGVWLRAALSGWAEADSESARGLLTAFVDGRLSHGVAREHGAAPDAGEGRSDGNAPGAGERFASVNPATGKILGHVQVSGPAEVNAAVRAAQRGQEQWAAMSAAERARVLRRAAELLRARNDELATLETRDTGKPIQETRVVDVVSGAECFEYFAGLVMSLSGEHIDLGKPGFGYTRREPLGVVAGIGAWNYPLQIAC